MTSDPQAPRVPLNFRISPERLESYDAMSDTYKLDRATVIRAHLAVAEKHKDEVREMLTAIKAGQS